jgi:predicted transcriptional regulator with HTH domain
MNNKRKKNKKGKTEHIKTIIFYLILIVFYYTVYLFEISRIGKSIQIEISGYLGLGRGTMGKG